MSEIDTDQEFIFDWDWYAYDLQGNIGHFTTAGLRSFPRSVRQDREALKQLHEYLATLVTKARVSIAAPAGVESGRSRDARARDKYLSSFVGAAEKGLFSYNTEIARGSEAKYYLVAKPENPIHIGSLPERIQTIVRRTQAPVSFVLAEYIPEKETLQW